MKKPGPHEEDRAGFVLASQTCEEAVSKTPVSVFNELHLVGH